METERKVARIASTFLGVEDHGILTAYLNCEGEGWGQCAGGYAFDGGRRDFKGLIPGWQAAHFIRRICEVAGVDKWEDLPGQLVYLISTHTRVQAIEACNLTNKRGKGRFDFSELSGPRPGDLPAIEAKEVR